MAVAGETKFTMQHVAAAMRNFVVDDYAQIALVPSTVIARIVTRRLEIYRKDRRSPHDERIIPGAPYLRPDAADNETLYGAISKRDEIDRV